MGHLAHMQTLRFMCNVHLGLSTTIYFQTLVEQARGILETIDGVTTVHGRFYELCSNYHKVGIVSLIIFECKLHCKAWPLWQE